MCLIYRIVGERYDWESSSTEIRITWDTRASTNALELARHVQASAVINMSNWLAN